MAKNSHIEWTHHTFNPWWGCTKVSAACDNCYADLWARRLGRKLWGRDASRRFFSDSHWKEPLRWNREAQNNNQRARVFCASMADVFERRADLNAPRERLWQLIVDTPYLDWLLLTKRPQNITRYAPWTTNWPINVWLGTSVENQQIAEKRLPFLLAIPSVVRFLSCEPLLGMIDLKEWFNRSGLHPIDWIIAGGESGGHSRPMHPDWALGLLNQCLEFDVPFHFKQWGHWTPIQEEIQTSRVPILIELQNERPVEMIRTGKQHAGRILRGVTWDEVPQRL